MTEWEAKWVRAPLAESVTDFEVIEAVAPAPIFRREFELAAPPAEARLRVSALGLYEARINGTRVGDEELAPGWTDYRRRVQFQSYDVAPLLHAGVNAVAIVAGDGWYSGRVGFFGRGVYGDQPAVLAQLELLTAAGERLTLASDESWLTAPSGILANDLQLGEHNDLAAWPPGWDLPGAGEEGWQPVRLQAPTGAELVAAVDPGVTVVARLEPRSRRWRQGRCLLDFGQNLVGRVRIELEAGEGERIEVRHGEALDDEGELFVANLREARQLDVHLTAAGSQVLEPRFTFHGFRYAEISGPRALLESARIEARVLSARIEPSGEWSCSDPMLCQLQSNIVWGQRGNFISVPTDCPQRDERLGWTGDAQVFAATAAFNADVLGFFRKWLIDLEDAQLPSGAYPDVAPDPHRFGAGNAGWGDAGILIPWCLYVRYGAGDLLERHYPAMLRHLEFLRADSTGGIRSAGRYGDWLSLEPQPTPREVVGTAYLARCAERLGQIAAVLGDERQASECQALCVEARAAFASRFLEADGAVAGATQSGQVLAIEAGAVPPPLRAAAAQRLVELIEAAGGHLTTGFLGTPAALPILSDLGWHELACRLAQRRDYPSWGFQIEQGATTLWERWDSWTPDRGFQKDGMNSFNHYAFGAVGDWLYRYLGGLAPDPAGPGYRRAHIHPRPGGTVERAALAYDSVAGRWEVEWERSGASLSIRATVPAGAEAELIVDAPPAAVAVLAGEPSPFALRPEGGGAVATAGPGRYELAVELGEAA